jgi:hypothetical protein
MRQTPRFVAGSRFKYTPDSIDFNYENLVNAIGDAIDKQAKEYDNKYVTDAPVERDLAPQTLSFDDLIDQFNTLVVKIQEATGSSFGTKWDPKIVEITDRYLGRGKKVSDATPKQAEQLELIVDELTKEVGLGL